MKVIKPPIAKKAKPVTDIKNIRRDISLMRQLLDNGKVDHKKGKPLFLTHQHVSYTPLNFLVIRKELGKVTNNQYVFINPHILEVGETKDIFPLASPAYPERGLKEFNLPNEILVQYTQINGVTVRARMRGIVGAIIQLAMKYVQ